MTAVVDYAAGNIGSVTNALRHLGEQCIVTADADAMRGCDRVILPGVGSFRAAMESLEERGLVSVLHDITESGIPLLGVCLGLQLLFESSEEAPGVRGLGLIPGQVVRIPCGDGLKVPHVGWNSLHYTHDSVLFRGIPEGSYVYFVHSYYAQALRSDDVTAVAYYGVSMDVAVERRHIYATQFHPEKSSAVGLGILRNFIEHGGDR